MLVKRLLDLIISSAVLIVLSPLMLVIYVLILINLGGPAFFVQERVGKDNKVFKMIKFRTMKDSRDKDGNLLSDNERVTKFGSFLRSFSLDELPELINIIKGDMSLVGPRALLVQYLECYNDEQIRRHDVLPGLTGWAQINGRNSITWSEKFKLDVWYVDNWSLWLDIKIFFLTFWKVVKREGINQSETVTMEYFNGSN
ncbi:MULTISPECIES: sugar transferase [unclassified Clostridium]|jgi:lipopolysaccharide/colanic/teichoic acid biosynthesis glycosyltransferase|uniref:sugar transferase n=1 Tax=Clostridium TaxID=1485 RepID=UPI001C8CAFD2|nr:MULTISPECIES: sugar transferase [unclassified Clostridium]MBX9136325.1 sugar transferase [Clostridium sp. K12(2020)]MBX9143403.1 sugar transferase [Clostridium sp. K13]MDU2290999.1 sugar transferase [Clostridium celatum]MDU4323831.1 sugar transferase [Clostridium celatum]